MSYAGNPPPPPPPPGPPGGYGGFGGPSAPPPGGYPAPQQYDVMVAVNYGWAKFQAYAGQMILAALAIFAGALVIGAVGVVAILLPADDGLTVGSVIALVALYVAFFIYAQVVGAGLIREALGVTEGRPFSTAGVFRFDHFGKVLATSLLVGLGTLIGTILCILPGIVFGFMSMYALYFVIERGMGPVDAIGASIDLVKNNLSPTIIWYLIAMVIVFVGELACFVGLLVAIPVVLVGSAYTYKRLTGQPVAP